MLYEASGCSFALLNDLQIAFVCFSDSGAEGISKLDGQFWAEHAPHTRELQSDGCSSYHGVFSSHSSAVEPRSRPHLPYAPIRRRWRRRAANRHGCARPGASANWRPPSDRRRHRRPCVFDPFPPHPVSIAPC